jgi:sortase B
MRKGLLLAGLALIAVAAIVLGLGMESQEAIPYSVHEVPLESECGAAESGDGEASAGEYDGIDWGTLPESVVAWVQVPGTTIDYPAMQEDADSPSYYLNHSMDGSYSAWGTPYIDAGCALGTESPLVIVYGHHMSDGTMFAPLAQYSNRAFAEVHRTIRVFTREKSYELRVFAVDVVDASTEGKRSDISDTAELNAYIGDKLSQCEVVLENPSNLTQAWAFVTCSYQTSNSRTVVYAADSADD